MRGIFFGGDLRADASIGPYREQTFRLQRRERPRTDMESAPTCVGVSLVGASNARPYKGDFIAKNPVPFCGHRIF